MKSLFSGLITSKTRVRILMRLFHNPKQHAYLRELSDEFGLAPSQVREELRQLNSAGLLSNRKNGRQILYSANTDHPLFPELHSMVRKALGMDRILESIVGRLGDLEKVYLIDRAITEVGFQFNNKTIAVLGLAFKKHTNDMRDASSIKVIESLLGKGAARIRAYDPLAIETAAAEFSVSKNILFEKIDYFHTAREALEGSHALFISSDCEEFRGLSRTIEETVGPPYLVMDGRRMIPDFEEMVSKGFSYLAVGAMAMKPE